MFKISGKTIQITRGDTGMFTLSIKSGGQPYDYSNDQVLCKMIRAGLMTIDDVPLRWREDVRKALEG